MLKAMSLLFLFLGLVIPGLAMVSKTMRLELVHRHSARELLVPRTQVERVKELLYIDHHRMHMISQRIGTRRRDLETTTAANLLIKSGAYTGTGQYFVRFKVGTPSQKFLLVADTGSDLTWMNCRHHCDNCEGRIHRRRVFFAGGSSTFEPIPCSTDMCQTLPFSLAQCSTPTSPCQYDYRYADGSTAHGIFANETVTVGLANGRKMKLHDVVIGCSSSLEGSSFTSSDGVLGLGYSSTSFVLKAKEIFGGKFSYCLVDHLSPKNVSSFLTFGHNSINTYAGWENMQYTKLVLNVINGFYPVNVAGISIGGVMLDIAIKVWDVHGEGGVIVDSGTSLTFLVEPAYIAVMDALKKALRGVNITEVEMQPFEYCFNSTGGGFDESSVPRLVIHFADSARLEPAVKSYVIDVADGVKCLGFMSNTWPDVSIIGNIMQQNFVWEFDTLNQRLGFAPTDCTTN